MLQSLQDAIKKIESGRLLVIAGDEGLLAKLPKGNWVGGSIPYFMDAMGGKISKDEVFVNDLTDCALGAEIKTYGVGDLPNIAKEAPEHGFSVIIIPAFTEAHFSYAQNAPNYEGIFMKPVVGWISGLHLDDLGKVTPKVFNGLTGASLDKEAIVMHFQIDATKNATVNILNVFDQGDGDTVTFDEEGFEIRNCIVNGKKQKFSEWVSNCGADIKLPLVADYCGAKINVSYQATREADGAVLLYAPVFKGVEYKIAKPVPDYVSAFQKIVPDNPSPVFACNCILNFLYSELEGKVIKNMDGPITFGEIAYQLLNQTLVYLEVK
ncbi:MAG: hypothetical protein FWG12_00650 [Holophagaceae bacterium]|nr:hypothetical protein [Holophagaceae bacterium]